MNNPEQYPNFSPGNGPERPSWLERLVEWGNTAIDRTGRWFQTRLLSLTGRLDWLAERVAAEGAESILDEILNSDWMFGLTYRGARYRRRLVTVVGAVLWAYFAYRISPPNWDVSGGAAFLTYPFRALFTWTLFPLVVVISLLFQALLLVALLFIRNIRRETLILASRLMGVLLALLWALLAAQLTAPGWGVDFAKNLVAYPFEALFDLGMLRHIIPAGLAFWAAHRIASYYLADIYELEDFRLAERFINQAVFASEYDTIEIEGGTIAPRHSQSIIAKIGGPGFLRVHLDSAAVLENIDGSIRVVGPTGDQSGERIALGGFERLRKAVDLRYFVEEMSLKNERTRDGMRISLENVTIIFSIYRAHQVSTAEVPYPFNPDSVRKVVFAQEREPVQKVAAEMIRRALQEFIGRHTLNEFLASTGEAEASQSSQEELNIRQDLMDLGGVEEFIPELRTGPLAVKFKTRPDIMTSLFAEQFQHQAAEKGIEILWIGGGTWVNPEEIVPTKHVQAWRLSRENLLRGNDQALQKHASQIEQSELIGLVRGVPVAVAQQLKGEPQVKRLQGIIRAYREKLLAYLTVYWRKNPPPEGYSTPPMPEPETTPPSAESPPAAGDTGSDPNQPGAQTEGLSEPVGGGGTSGEQDDQSTSKRVQTGYWNAPLPEELEDIRRLARYLQYFLARFMRAESGGEADVD